MGDFRARDADRDRAVETIEAAYVDGQLGDADRELRVSRALSAETLDELTGLTRDLQGAAAHEVVRPAPLSPAQLHAVASDRRPARTGLVVAGVVAAVVGVLALVPLVFLSTGNSDWTSSTGIDAPAVSSQAAAAEPASFEMTPGQVRRFLRAYEKRFGTLEAFEVGFFPQRVGVQVPVRGARPRMERWTWDGDWRQDTTAAAVRGPSQRVDAGAIDVRRLFANIEVAEQGLDVEEGRFTHALLVRWNGEPTELNIYVGNELGESGYLSTTPAGEVQRRHPYAP
ncbi:protein of unknown function [Nocardioides alpinus]|uniref:DUF1707 domain-containing protein n=1 Tax=Nocardioides alpinus TaxID=748909 RepID=A0A1I0YEK3_9ACTN|nr:DUF1707 domain-containing protein [Nocardioides alpinus]PKH38906.1 DUF1707 domain-containing protein [Nocardioides alpinus]SFB10940.1 protein of unknown function [Nocardioides alpinus]